MSDTHIRHTRRSKHYMAPVLLDHASQRKLAFSMLLALVVIFMSGYVAGFKKAEVKLATPIATVALELPATVAGTLADIEPQRPMLAEPGELIDVDSVDKEEVAGSKVAGYSEIIDIAQIQQNVVLKQADQVETEKIKVAEVQLVETKSAEKKQPLATTPSHPMAIGGPAESDPGQRPVQLIQDTATEENAVYSIQVGMYGQLDNAERKVEELIANDLSAYLTDFLNKKNEIRYNVRFGYFADRKSARLAMAAYEKELSGSGYIVRLQSEASANTGS